jgi:hypothetical protein
MKKKLFKDVKIVKYEEAQGLKVVLHCLFESYTGENFALKVKVNPYWILRQNRKKLKKFLLEWINTKGRLKEIFSDVFGALKYEALKKYE